MKKLHYNATGTERKILLRNLSGSSACKRSEKKADTDGKEENAE